jgi:hypothetical protein
MGPVWVVGLIDIVAFPVIWAGLRFAHLPILKQYLSGIALCLLGMGVGQGVKWLLL